MHSILKAHEDNMNYQKEQDAKLTPYEEAMAKFKLVPMYGGMDLPTRIKVSRHFMRDFNALEFLALDHQKIPEIVDYINMILDD